MSRAMEEQAADHALAMAPDAGLRSRHPKQYAWCSGRIESIRLSYRNEIARCARGFHAKMADRFGEAFHRMRHVL